MLLKLTGVKLNQPTFLLSDKGIGPDWIGHHNKRNTLIDRLINLNGFFFIFLRWKTYCWSMSVIDNNWSKLERNEMVKMYLKGVTIFLKK